VRTMPGERLWTPMCLSPAAARSSANDTLSCVRADFVLLCVHAVLDSCADPRRIMHHSCIGRPIAHLSARTLKMSHAPE